MAETGKSKVISEEKTEGLKGGASSSGNSGESMAGHGSERMYKKTGAEMTMPPMKADWNPMDDKPDPIDGVGRGED